MRTSPTKEQTDTKIEELANKYFFGPGFVEIMSHGAWHIGSTSGKVVTYNGSTRLPPR
jgi:hypothetical protein